MMHSDILPTVIDAADPAMRVYALNGSLEARHRVAIGEPFIAHTLDASGNQIRPGVADHQLDPPMMFPVTGPIAVTDVAQGDGVGIIVRSITPAARGYMWTRPGLGLLPSPGLYAREFTTNALHTIVNGRKVVVPPNLHVGTLGVCPSEPHAGRDLGAHGGNLDTIHLQEGSTLWLRAQVPGAGIYVGDVHAAMGDGEICGTGVEVSAKVELAAVRTEGWAPRLPTVVTKEHNVWVIAYGHSLDDTLRIGASEVLARIQTETDLTPHDAYLCVSAHLRLNICQVVNPKTSVAVSLSSGLDELLVPLAVRSTVLGQLL